MICTNKRVIAIDRSSSGLNMSTLYRCSLLEFGEWSGVLQAWFGWVPLAEVFNGRSAPSLALGWGESEV